MYKWLVDIQRPIFELLDKAIGIDCGNLLDGSIVSLYIPRLQR
jgi:hypothetical protein